MSFAELRAFNAVVQHMSFVKAAQELGRAQPTLTSQIAQLEKSYGVELIIRNRGGLKGLTPIGMQLFEITRTLVTLERDAQNLLRDAGTNSRGEIRLAATAPILAARLLKVFGKSHPNIDCHLQFGNSKEVLSSILDCKADFGILAGKPDHSECLSIPIAEPEIVLVGHKNHPAATSGTISRKQIAKETLLIREPGSETRELVINEMEKFNYQPSRLVEIGSCSGAVAAATEGMGLAAVFETEFEPSDKLCIIRFADFQVSSVVCAICLAGRSKTAASQALLEACHSLRN